MIGVDVEIALTAAASAAMSGSGSARGDEQATRYLSAPSPDLNAYGWCPDHVAFHEMDCVLGADGEDGRRRDRFDQRCGRPGAMTLQTRWTTLGVRASNELAHSAGSGSQFALVAGLLEALLL